MYLVFCRLVGHAGVLAGGRDFAADFRIYKPMFCRSFCLYFCVGSAFTFDVSVTSIWKSTSTRSMSREGIGTNPINGALTLCDIVVIFHPAVSVFRHRIPIYALYCRFYHQMQFAGRNSMLSLPIPVVLRLLQ